MELFQHSLLKSLLKLKRFLIPSRKKQDDTVMGTSSEAEPVYTAEQRRQLAEIVNAHARLVSQDPPEESLSPPQIHLGQVLDKNVRLSEACLWDLVTAYYKTQDLETLGQTTFFLTNSRLMAELYARLILATLTDILPLLQSETPVYIVELGAGIGRFGYYLLTELSRQITYFPDLSTLKLCYVMTDCNRNRLDFWTSHEKLLPFVEKGWLDFATFSPETDPQVTLEVSGRQLTSKDFLNPTLVIANCFFDGLKQDVFRIQAKQLQEGRVTITRQAKPLLLGGHPTLSELQVQFDYTDISHPYYTEPVFKTILKTYVEQCTDATILFPLGALHTIQNLEKLTRNQLILLSSDKGLNELSRMRHLEDYQYVRHDGALLYDVNYHAIRNYYETMGGTTFYSTDVDISLQTVLCLPQLSPSPVFESLRYLFEHDINQVNPVNYISQMTNIFTNDTDCDFITAVSSLLSYMHLTRNDPKIFCEGVRILGEHLKSMTPLQQQELFKTMADCWAHYYYYPAEPNLPFWIGKIYVAFGEYDKGLAYLQKSIVYYPHEIQSYILAGQCAGQRQDLESAKSYFQKALALDPQDAQALTGLSEIENRRTLDSREGSSGE